MLATMEMVRMKEQEMVELKHVHSQHQEELEQSIKALEKEVASVAKLSQEQMKSRQMELQSRTEALQQQHEALLLIHEEKDKMNQRVEEIMNIDLQQNLQTQRLQLDEAKRKLDDELKALQEQAEKLQQVEKINRIE